MTFIFPLTDFILDARNPPELTSLPADQTILLIKNAMGSLADLANVWMDNGCVLIMLSDPKKSTLEESTRLTNLGINFAKQGQHEKAIDAFEESLQILPIDKSTRRNLAMVQFESGKSEEAENNLIQVLALDPKDAEALIILGNIFAQRNDNATAERLFGRAIEVKHNNVVALTNYATILGKENEFERADTFFNKAIDFDPTYPNAYLGMAVLCQKQERWERGLLALNDLFTKASNSDLGATGLFKQSRSLYVEMNWKVAEKSLQMVDSFVVEHQKQLEASGIPIEVIQDLEIEAGDAVTKMAWRYHTDHHVIRITPSTPVIRPHILCHEFEHIVLETEARAAGRNKTFVASTSIAVEKAKNDSQDFVKYLTKQGIKPTDFDTILRKMVNGLMNQLYNNPLDMFIETRLNEKYDVLRPNQFESLRKWNSENVKVLLQKEIAINFPQVIYIPSLVMNASFALFTDHLFKGKTAYADPYRRHVVFPIAENLFHTWMESAKLFNAGDEYDLVEEFGRVLKLEDWFRLQPDDTAEHEGGVTNEDLLKAKESATVMYLVSALKRFSKMSDGEIKSIASEVALLGQHGIDYDSASAKYSLRSLPGEKFSGLQLMCLMFVGLKHLDSTMNTGIPFDSEFEVAKKLFGE